MYLTKSRIHESANGSIGDRVFTLHSPHVSLNMLDTKQLFNKLVKYKYIKSYVIYTIEYNIKLLHQKIMKGLWAIPRQFVGACQVDISLRKFFSYFWGIFKHVFSLNGAFLGFFSTFLLEQ